MTKLIVTRPTGRLSNPAQRLTGALTPAPSRAGIQHPKMVIAAQGLPPFVVPYAPRESSADGFTPDWQTVARGGREPMLLRAGGSLLTYSFDLIVAYFDPNQPIQAELNRLQRIAAAGKRCRITFDPFTASTLWRLTSYSEQVLARQHGTNKPTRAICSIGLTEVSDPAKSVGPVSGGGGKGGKGGGGGGDGKDDDDKKRPKSYVFKRGDTLQSVAKEFYDDASLWSALADHNNITRPNKVAAGKRLKLPKKKVLTGD